MVPNSLIITAGINLFQDGKMVISSGIIPSIFISRQSAILTSLPPLKGNAVVIWVTHQYSIFFFLLSRRKKYLEGRTNPRWVD